MNNLFTNDTAESHWVIHHSANQWQSQKLAPGLQLQCWNPYREPPYDWGSGATQDSCLVFELNASLYTTMPFRQRCSTLTYQQSILPNSDFSSAMVAMKLAVGLFSSLSLLFQLHRNRRSFPCITPLAYWTQEMEAGKWVLITFFNVLPLHYFISHLKDKSKEGKRNSLLI